MDVPFLSLSGAAPLVAGRSSAVYRHPSNPALLVKVSHGDVRARPLVSAFGWTRSLRRLYKERVILRRELKQYSLYQREGRPYPEFLQQFHGLVQTEHGLARIVTAEWHGDDYARTLRQLAMAGEVDDTMLAELDAFFTWLVAAPIVVGDVHADNLVYADRQGGKRFVLIDGLGDKTLVPLGAWSVRFRIATKRRIIRFVRLQLARFENYAARNAGSRSFPDQGDREKNSMSLP